MLNLNKIIAVLYFGDDAKLIEPSTGKIYRCENIIPLQSNGKYEVCAVLVTYENIDNLEKLNKIIPLNELVTNWTNYVPKKEEDEKE